MKRGRRLAQGQYFSLQCTGLIGKHGDGLIAESSFKPAYYNRLSGFSILPLSMDLLDT